VEIVRLDDDEEAAKERAIEEACYVNRALCNLELREPVHRLLFGAVLNSRRR
jgi:hypothetical protein